MSALPYAARGTLAATLPVMFGPTGAALRDKVTRAAASPWLARAARVGMVAQAVVYAVIGYFALKLALGDGGALLAASETSRPLRRQHFGDGMVFLLGAGLACFAAGLRSGLARRSATGAGAGAGSGVGSTIATAASARGAAVAVDDARSTFTRWDLFGSTVTSADLWPASVNMIS